MKRRRIRSLDTLQSKVGEKNFKQICYRYIPTLQNNYISTCVAMKEIASTMYVDYDMTKTAATKILEDFNNGVLDKYLPDSEPKGSESVIDDFLSEIF